MFLSLFILPFIPLNNCHFFGVRFSYFPGLFCLCPSRIRLRFGHTRLPADVARFNPSVSSFCLVHLFHYTTVIISTVGSWFSYFPSLSHASYIKLRLGHECLPDNVARFICFSSLPCTTSGMNREMRR